MDIRRALSTLTVVAAVLVMAATYAAGGKSGLSPSKDEGVEATVVGENYCLGCSLKKEYGAAAQCSKYGHRHGLRVESAVDAGGKALPDLKGRTLSYLDNDKSEGLIKGEKSHGARVEVKGRLFSMESVIEVQDFRSLQ